MAGEAGAAAGAVGAAAGAVGAAAGAAGAAAGETRRAGVVAGEAVAGEAARLQQQ